MLLIGEPSFSMGHLYHGYVSHNQMVDCDEPFGWEPAKLNSPGELVGFLAIL